MPNYLEYLLDPQGYIHNWLVAGPQDIHISDLDHLNGDPAQFRTQIVHTFHDPMFDLHEPPLEWALFEIGGVRLEWRYVRCREDHLLDLSGFYPGVHYLRAWAYAEINTPVAGEFNLSLATHGPVDVWINRRHVCGQVNGSEELHDTSFKATFQEGRNELLVRFERVAIGPTPFAMALRLEGPPLHNTLVQLPVAHSNVARRQKLERIYQEAYVEHALIHVGENLILRWDDHLEEEGKVDFWIQDEREHIKSVGMLDIRPAERVVTGGRVLALEEGAHAVALLPPAPVIERFDIRYKEFLPFYVLETPYSPTYYGDDTQRRREALEYAARREGNLYAEIARLALGRRGAIDQAVLGPALAQIEQCQADGILNLIGILGLLYRYPDTFTVFGELRQRVEAAVLNFRYRHDEPRLDWLDHVTESQTLLVHTAELLAGQLYPTQRFSDTGQDGAWHRQNGERLVLAWLNERGSKGFADWDSPTCFEEILVALVHLAGWAENTQVAELAVVMIDKLLITLAVNSYRGVFGSTQRHAETAAVKSGALGAMAGVARLMWGMGVWNHHLRALVSLAASEYELPTMIAALAVDLDREMWHKEHHPGVDKVTYRTADFMLCSAQDYRPGEKGACEHIWQATLGANAVVFVNHPCCMSENEAWRPNFWRGNGVLPRVAQWKDVLIAIHRLPQDDRTGFTHAYFPVYEFDEYKPAEPWAFARKGEGYLALRARQGFKLITRGVNGFRELRSWGLNNVWLCMLGRQTTDGSFDEFCTRIAALDVTLNDLSAHCQTLRGDTLSFAWDEPFQVNGQAVPLTGFKHYDGPACVAEWPAEQIEIRYGDYTLRLRFD